MYSPSNPGRGLIFDKFWTCNVGEDTCGASIGIGTHIGFVEVCDTAVGKRVSVDAATQRKTGSVALCAGIGASRDRESVGFPVQIDVDD